MLFLFGPLVLVGVRNKPEDIGLLPDGIVHEKNPKSIKETGKSMPITEENGTLRQATKTVAFWTILICVGILALVNTGITFHLISIM